MVLDGEGVDGKVKTGRGRREVGVGEVRDRDWYRVGEGWDLEGVEASMGLLVGGSRKEY